jgi:hypothetical protein
MEVAPPITKFKELALRAFKPVNFVPPVATHRPRGRFQNFTVARPPFPKKKAAPETL